VKIGHIGDQTQLGIAAVGHAGALGHMVVGKGGRYHRTYL
jgi:hypothetical protein